MDKRFSGNKPEDCLLPHILTSHHNPSWIGTISELSIT